MGNYTQKFNDNLKSLDLNYKTYARWELQSYMTGPEWRNVEMAEEFADYLREGNSLFTFPYFSQIADLWRVMGKSYRAARKYNSHFEIWFKTDYMLMDLFVPFFTTLELLPKGIFSLLLRPFISAKNVDGQGNLTDFQQYLAAYFLRYATKLQTMPFYDHPYAEESAKLKAAYDASQHKTFVDRVSYYLVAFDLWARKWISKPLYAMFHSEGNLVAATTDILVKYRVENEKDTEKAKAKFREELDFANTSQSEEKRAVIVDEEQVFAKQKIGGSYTEVYARLRAPRYGAFQDTLATLAEHNIHLRRSGGNDHVQVKAVLEAANPIQLAQLKQQVAAKVDARVKAETEQETSSFLYSYSDRIHPNREICLFDVPVKNLHETVKTIKESGDHDLGDITTVKFIHHF